MSASTRLKEIREREGYSRKDFAKEFDIPYSTMTNYENGTRKPPYWLLLRIAQEWGVTVDYLLGNTDSPTPQGGNAGICGETEMRRGFEILLENIGVHQYADFNHWYIDVTPAGYDFDDCPPAAVTIDELKQLFTSTVDFVRFSAFSLYEKAAKRESISEQDN